MCDIILCTECIEYSNVKVNKNQQEMYEEIAKNIINLSGKPCFFGGLELNWGFLLNKFTPNTTPATVSTPSDSAEFTTKLIETQQQTLSSEQRTDMKYNRVV